MKWAKMKELEALIGMEVQCLGTAWKKCSLTGYK